MRHFLFLYVVITISFSQPSRIELHTHFSQTLGISKSYNILLPEGYNAETDHYPVVYLFRGAVDEWADPLEDASRRGTIKTVFDSLYAKKQVGKMILVMPGLSAPATTNEYSYITNDLIPHIDTAYRTIPTRWYRAMDGFSLGGLVVTNLMVGAPHLFCSAGSYDGTLSLFNNDLLTNASPSLVYALRQMQLLYHTASIGGNNNANNQTTFGILNSKGIFNSLPSFVLNPNASHNWFYADWHMAITLPLHWQKMMTTGNMLNVQFSGQFNTEKQSGNILPSWQSGHVPSTTTMLFASSDNGATWSRLFVTSDSTEQYSWNTALFPDGTLYSLKIILASDTLFGRDITEVFTVDNPGNGAPDIELQSFSNGDRITDTLKFITYIGDADGDSLTVTGEISVRHGSPWQPVFRIEKVLGIHEVNIVGFPNSTQGKVRAWVTDRQDTVYSKEFNIELAASRISLPPSSVHHIAGISTASVTVHVVNSDDLTGHTYRIHFRKENGTTVYDIIDSTLDTIVVSGADQLSGSSEGPLFDGIRLMIDDVKQPQYLHDSSGWNNPAITLDFVVSLIDLTFESVPIIAEPVPNDFRITVYPSIVDTSLSIYDAPAVPVNFTVINSTLDIPTPFVFIDLDNSGSISMFDEIYIFQNDENDSLRLSWHIFFTGGNAVELPNAGDILTIATTKPLTELDQYEFTGTLTTVSLDKSGPEDFSMDPVYPNPFNPVTHIRYSLSRPARVELSVHDILGRKIADVVNKTLPAGVYKSAWNASGFSSGVYFLRFKTGSHIHTQKMVLLR